MKAAQCARNSRRVLDAQYRERKLNDTIDKRSKNGKGEEDAYSKNYAGCDENGCRIWSF